MAKGKHCFMGTLAIAIGCLGQSFVSPAEAILMMGNVPDTFGDTSAISEKFQYEPDLESYAGAIFSLAVQTGNQALLASVTFVNSNDSIFDMGNNWRSEDSRNLYPIARTITTASWKTSVLPLIGATVFFSGGMWLKRKQEEKSLAVLEETKEVK